MRTSLIIKGKNVTVITDSYDEGVYIQLYECDDDFKPIGNPEKYIDTRLEEDYHKDLRSEFNKINSFVPKYSTNPELNPK
jgi:hypothetical protein